MKEFFKSKKKMAIIAGVLIAVITIGTISVYANAAMKVEAYTADIGELSSILEINGNVESDSMKTYYSKVDGTIGKVHVKAGDFVKKGDIIVSYDADEIERLTAIAQSYKEADLENYNNAVQTGKRTAGLYGEATRNIKVLDQQIADTQAALIQRQNDLANKRAALADEGAKLQISLIDWADKPDSEEFENLQKLVQTNAYEQQYSSEILQMQEEINSLGVALEGYKTYKAEMSSQKAATQMGLMTDGAKEKIEAIKTANELASDDTIANLNEAAGGIRAEFDGVVSGINVIEGCSVGKGTELVTIKSIDDVVVKLKANKYDIVNIEEGQITTVVIKNKEYTGKVSRISRMADEGGQSSAIGVEVKLDAPDSNIILGIEVKAKIQTANANDALRVPAHALWEDEDGTFVFVVKDDKAVKTKVETGVRNENMVEICSGINKGDVVVWNENSEITDGMSVKVNK